MAKDYCNHLLVVDGDHLHCGVVAVMAMMFSGILPTLPWNRGTGAKGFQVREQKDLLHGVAPHDVLPQDLHILLIVGYVECVVIGLHHNFSLTLFTKKGVLSTAFFGVFFK